MDGAQSGDANAEGGQQHSSVNAVEQQLSELAKLVGDLSGQVKALQGGKDRGVHNTQKQVDALQNQIKELTEAQEYLAKYEDPAEAARQQMLDRMIRQGSVDSQTGSQGADKTGSANLEQTQSDADKELFELLGVDAAGEDYIKAVSSGLSPLEAAKTVAKANQVAQQQDPNAALGIGGGGGGATGITGSQKQILQSQFEAEMEEKKDELQGNPWFIEEVKRKYREKGLDVW
jgi:hypothetical protein